MIQNLTHFLFKIFLKIAGLIFDIRRNSTIFICKNITLVTKSKRKHLQKAPSAVKQIQFQEAKSSRNHSSQ